MSKVQKPQGVLSSYLAAAMRHAIFQRVGEQQRVYATIPGISGLWARGPTREEATRDLREALEWWVLTSVFEHRPLPAFGDALLEIEEESAAGSRIVYPAARQNDANEAGAQGPDAHEAHDGS
jgi:predicted RNase H-like HicB family nuclease